MSNDVAIRVEGLGKRYRLGERSAPYRTLREAIMGVARAPRGLLGRRAAADDTLWALKDVDLEVRRGEVLGVIGRNGAGKTTLLKILSRITEPTTGRVELHGRVGSLLEVGTGFHPELTGRENIYLNGAILGMRKAEIERKFDEIVAFAEVERFLDTPVKHYSSGMYVRLAFAVAAHLEPEILLVDEVLAVGDAAFQKKCLGKMGEVAGAGRTVLFVSHNMLAVNTLCSRVVLLRDGSCTADGAPGTVVGSYLNDTFAAGLHTSLAGRTRRGSGCFRFLSCVVRGEPGPPVSGAKASFELRYQSESGRPLSNVHVALGIRDMLGQPLFHLSTNVAEADFEALPPTGCVRCELPELPLQPGVYRLTIFGRAGSEIADWVENAVEFAVEGGDFFATGTLPPGPQGPLLVHHTWIGPVGAPQPL